MLFRSVSRGICGAARLSPFRYVSQFPGMPDFPPSLSRSLAPPLQCSPPLLLLSCPSIVFYPQNKDLNSRLCFGLTLFFFWLSLLLSLFLIIWCIRLLKISKLIIFNQDFRKILLAFTIQNIIIRFILK